ncbi:N-acetylglucosamine-6-phosphate deacetylase [Herbivorax sp. ANBcel31]|uniref:N-acetylglucosamine-6-phosphate deacetylase n=1 Tax=Herbivorax sp. ANBcel31 TaxID=3069754 RepID=UPI0027B3E860|nr:N-acetylglucosamine-6-phosphate deacetylase [Herbivorax sp. ANBcel31]MDQ2085142.1 N-acetylglucosamine-6-phosphate deacetylase [Herbivorax sp. ANBcel31]
MKLIKNGLVFHNKSFEKKDILIDGTKIVNIGKDITENECKIIDAYNCWVLPGFIDIHTHGGIGCDVMTGKYEELDKLSYFFASKGVTSFLPVVMTGAIEEMLGALRNIKLAIRKKTSGAKIIGINMEGPFINHEYKGAHPIEHITLPSIELLERFIDEAGGSISMMTMAPELEGVFELVNHFKESGIVFCAGHTAADYNMATNAFERGFSHVTHLFNAMARMHHRSPGLAGAALEKENISVELIGDGIHVNPAFIKMALKCKSSDNIILITDSIIATGLESGSYYFAGKEIYVENGVSKDKNGVIAGGTITMIDAMKNMVQKWDIPIKDCIKMIVENPSKIAGVFNKKGSLSYGKDADIIIVDKNMNVLLTMAEGNIVYKA